MFCFFGIVLAIGNAVFRRVTGGRSLTDNRTPRRYKKRFSVHFGIEEANRVAFTEDISVTGMFIKSMNVCPPNTKILIEFSPDDANRVVLEARVMWAKKVPQNLFHLVKKSGMGVRILHFHFGEEHYLRFCAGMGATS
jgi:hypothetical protein